MQRTCRSVVAQAVGDISQAGEGNGFLGAITEFAMYCQALRVERTGRRVVALIADHNTQVVEGSCDALLVPQLPLYL